MEELYDHERRFVPPLGGVYLENANFWRQVYHGSYWDRDIQPLLRIYGQQYDEGVLSLDESSRIADTLENAVLDVPRIEGTPLDGTNFGHRASSVLSRWDGRQDELLSLANFFRSPPIILWRLPDDFQGDELLT